MKKSNFVTTALVLLSLTACASHVPAPPPATPPKSTDAAVRGLIIEVAKQCKENERALGGDFKTCFYQQLDAAVDQIRRGQRCASPDGCKPHTEQ